MIRPPKFWDGVLRRLGSELPAFTLEAWVRPLVAESCGEGVRLLCPTPFHRERIRDRFLGRIARCAEQETGRAVALELAVRAPMPQPAARPAARNDEPAPAARASEARPARHPGSAARPGQPALPYTFDNFVVGPSNALAREAAYALAQSRQRTLNPLYLTSANGMGKTHLARAILREAHAHGSRRGIYAPSETFTNGFMAAIRNKRMDLFKRRYREECDLLVLEDVQFLRSKSATQLELFHTLLHLLDAGVRVVLTGDRLPRDIEDLDPRLRSQITAGMVAEIEPPDAAVRRRILRSKAAAGGVRLPEDCLDLLVETTRGSVRDLEGVLIQLVATASLLKRPIDLELTQLALHKLAPVCPLRSLDPGAVIRVVAAFFGTRPEALAARSRRRDVMLPRQLAMYLCRRYTEHSLTAIARAFDREHPAVSNAVRSIERRILERAPLRYQVEELSARLDRLRLS